MVEGFFLNLHFLKKILIRNFAFYQKGLAAIHLLEKTRKFLIILKQKESEIKIKVSTEFSQSIMQDRIEKVLSSEIH